jgi:hypothetical protein
MKKILITLVFIVLVQAVNAQTGILEIIKAGVVKVIKAVDLKIQRLQNKTIWLQNAQKVIENKMSALKLDEISDWAEKQRKLYDDYFDELSKIKLTISNYRRVKEIFQKQVQLVNEYSKAYNLSKQDQNFSTGELDHMAEVYSGIIRESVKNLEELQLVISAYSTQMSDAKRLEIIHGVSERIDQNLADLRSFNQHNIRLSLQRAREKKDIDAVKKLYGLP